MRTEPSSARTIGERLARSARYHRAAFGVGLLFLLLTLLYNVTVPIWEADNEWSHFLYVRHLIAHRTVPSEDAAIDLPPFVDQCYSGLEVLEGEARHQFRQPPLYYLGAALVSSWIDISQGWSIAANSYRMWDPQNLGYNFALHSDAENFPYRGVTLAMHVLRLYSGLIGLSGLIAAYLLGLLFFAGRRELAVAVMALNAFIPQYVFSASTLNNDILVAALGAWCVYFSMRAVYRRTDLSALVLSWLTAGLAVAAKFNGLILGPLVLAVTGIVLWRALHQIRRQQAPREASAQVGSLQAGELSEVRAVEPRKKAQRALHIVAILGGGFAIAVLLFGLWAVRNVQSYGLLIGGYPLTLHPSALAEMVANIGRNLPAELRYTSVTFWGLMGWGTIPLPDPVITLLVVVMGLCLVGVALFVADRSEDRQLRGLVLLLVAFVAFAWFVVGIKDISAISPRGRYLLPAFSTISFLLVLGLNKLLPARIKVAGRWIFISGLLVLTLLVPPFLIGPAYATPDIAVDGGLLPGEQPAHVVFGDTAELIGYRIAPERVHIGDKLQVTLVWRALQETNNNYIVSMDLIDFDQFSHARVASHPGRGNYPTSRWRSGDVFRDTYELGWTMLDWEWWPGAAFLRVQVYCAGPDLAPTTVLDAVDQADAKRGTYANLGRLKVMQHAERVQERPHGREIFLFGDQLMLEDYWLSQALPGLGSTMEVGLVWRALTQPSTDYNMQVRVVDAQGRQVAGARSPAPNRAYPVDLWDAGEQVVQMHPLNMPARLPAGVYRVWLSVHEPQTGQRVPVGNAKDQSTQDEALMLYEFEVR